MPDARFHRNNTAIRGKLSGDNPTGSAFHGLIACAQQSDAFSGKCRLRYDWYNNRCSNQYRTRPSAYIRIRHGCFRSRTFHRNKSDMQFHGSDVHGQQRNKHQDKVQEFHALVQLSERNNIRWNPVAKPPGTGKHLHHHAERSSRELWRCRNSRNVNRDTNMYVHKLVCNWIRPGVPACLWLQLWCRSLQACTRRFLLLCQDRCYIPCRMFGNRVYICP